MSIPARSWTQIVNMSIGFLGIQFGWGLQMANMSAVYEYLGAVPDRIPLLWLAAPLTGLLLQPVVGYLSDRTWCRLGRRRPYFLGGALLAAAALFLMPYAGALWMAAGMLWILDSSVNISMEPFRAFVADRLPDAQRTRGYAMQTVFVALGAVLASAFPWLLTHLFDLGPPPASEPVPDALAALPPVHGAAHHLLAALPLLNHFFADALPPVIRIAFHTGAAVFLACILWTVCTCPEDPPADLERLRRERRERRGLAALAREVAGAVRAMPPTMRQLAGVQLFTWAGLFCLWMYFPVAMGHRLGTEGTPEYQQGIEWAGLCFAAYNGVALVQALWLPVLTRRLARRATYCLSLLCLAVSLIAVRSAHSLAAVMALMIGVGIGWAGVLTLPYAILAGALPRERLGLYMGLFNFFITIPQIVVSMGFGWLMRHALHNDRELGVLCGGVCCFIAALLTSRIQEPAAPPPARPAAGEAG